jgi:pyruvate dehydrogenase E2 component (dihydrolipoamide acetyltransferase)
MEVEMKMPDLATTDSDIRLIRWLAEPGQSIARGQPLLEIETDKAISQVEAIATGLLKKVHVAQGSFVAVGQVIAVFEVSGVPNVSALPAFQKPLATAVPHAVNPAPVSSAGKRESMFTRNRAATAQRTAIDKSAPALSANQLRVGRRMQTSKQTIPHFHLHTSANAEAISARRGQAGSHKLLWDAFFVSAVAHALREFERLRWRFDGGELVAMESDVIGVAVDVRGELYVVGISTPTSKTPSQISEEIRQVVERLEAGDLQARALYPATLTITNLGGSNIESFAAIINPPETAILAVGRIAPQPVAREGNILIERRVSLTLSVDHRIVNGKYAADFLNAIVRQIEAF